VIAWNLGCDPLPMGLGLGLGGPWVAQAWPKGHPSVTQGPSKGRFEETPLFATKEEKGRGGVEKDRVIGRSHVIGRSENPKPETTKDTRSTRHRLAQGRLRNTEERVELENPHRQGRRCHMSLLIAKIREPKAHRGDAENNQDRRSE